MAGTSRPTYLDRFTMIGDNIPQTKPAGAGGGSNRVYVDTTDTPTYSVGTRFIGFQEPATSGVLNRPAWALAENVAWLFEKEVAKPVIDSGTSSGGETYFSMTDVAFLGTTGSTASDIAKTADVLDANYDELEDGGLQIGPSDWRTEDLPDNPGTWVSAYPAGGLPTIGAGDTIATVADSGTGGIITMTSGLGGALTKCSIFNYDHWLREVRDGGTPSEAFATISTFTSTSNFKVNRQVSTLGWAIGDKLFLTHFAYQPRLYLSNTLTSAGVTWQVAYGAYCTLGDLPENAITSLKVRTAEAVPFDVEKFILGGLDAAYDQLGYGTAGGGRTVTVDSGPIFADIATDGEVGIETGSDTDAGVVGLLAYNRGTGTNTGMVAAQFMAAKVDTTWASPASCTATASNGEISLSAGNVTDAGGNSDIILDLDLAYIEDSGGDPVDIGGKAPRGLYIIDSLTNQTDFVVKYLDGSAVGAVMTGANKATWIRPIMAGSSGGLTGNLTNVFSAWGSGSTSSAANLFGVIDLGASPTCGDILRYYAGNVDSATTIVSDASFELTYASAGPNFSVVRNLGIVGADITDDDVVVVTLDKSDADDLYYTWEWTEPSSPSNEEPRWRFSGDVASLRTTTFDIFPYGPGKGLVGTGPVYSKAQLNFGDPAQDDSAFSYAYMWDGGLTKIAYYHSIKITGGNTVTLAIKESPTSPSPPTTTYNSSIAHRVEIDDKATFGFSNWIQINKTINAALGFNISATGTRNWDRRELYSTIVWQDTSDTVGHWIYFPILVPHGSRIDDVTLRFYSSAALSGTNGKLDVERHDRRTATGAGGSITINALSSGGTVSIDGSPSDDDYTYTCDQNNIVDLESYDYFVKVESGNNGGGSTQRIMNVRVKFSYHDIYAE